MAANVGVIIIVATTVFVLVAALWGIGILLYAARERRRQEAIESRLGLDDTAVGQSRTLRIWHEGREATTSVSQTSRGNLSQTVATLCRDAGWNAPVRSVLLAVAGLATGAAAMVLLILGSALLAVGAAFGVCVVFWVYLHRRIARRRALFESQLIDALELAARSLRVGHPLVAAFRLIAEEVNAPIGPIFGGVVQQQELGVPLDRAVQTAARDANSDDLSLFATSIVIQLRSGGNLADMMERVGTVMRDRMRLARRVRVLIAQTQISKQILMSLPVFVFFLLNLINPAYMHPLYSTRAGVMILTLAGGCLLVGWYVMNKLAAIRY